MTSCVEVFVRFIDTDRDLASITKKIYHEKVDSILTDMRREFLGGHRYYVCTECGAIVSTGCNS